MMAALGFAALAALFGLAMAPPVEALANRWRVGRRVGALRLNRPGRHQGVTTIRRAAGNRRDGAIEGWLPGGAVVAARLRSAGGRWSLTMLVVVAGVFAMALVMAGWALGLSPLLALLLLPVVALAAIRLGSAAVAARARAAFGAGFADAIAVMIRSLRAGLPVAAAVAEVASSGEGPVPQAFGAVVEDMRLGQPLETALWAAARRIDVPEFDFLVVVVALQRETGGNLAETLSGLDETLRMRRQLALKVKALAAEARASATIIASLPFAMAGLLWVTSPDYLVPLFATAMGRAMVGAGLASIGMGALIIREMLAIKP
jgi:tight adherence protein B